VHPVSGGTPEGAPHQTRQEPPIAAVDGLRGLAILLVLLCHGRILASGNAFDESLSAVLWGGWCGVDLFFVISGFLITGILYDARGSSRYYSSFYARRALRIFPLYYTFLFATLVVGPALFPEAYAASALEPSHHKWFWLYLYNVWAACRGLGSDWNALSITWSLCIEEHFYLFWPIVVACCSRRVLTSVCVATVAASFALRVVMGLCGAPAIAVYFLTPARLDGLAMGALIAVLVRGPQGMAGARVGIRSVIIALAAVLAGMLLLTGMMEAYQVYTRALGFTCLAVFFGGLLVQTLTAPTGSGLTGLFESRFLQVLGKYSYALYLLHQPVNGWLKPRVPFLGDWKVMGSALPGQTVYYVLAIGTSLALAFLSWHLLEKHFLRLKSFFPYR
jgi:peptidoglycan/LPS O-acetylase OafA/YrhL